MAEHFKFTAVEVAAESQALAERLAGGGHRPAENVEHRCAVGPFDLTGVIAHIEIELSVRPEIERVYAVIVVDPGDPGEEDLFLVRFIVSVGIGEYENIRGTRHNHAVAQHANAQRSVNV